MNTNRQTFKRVIENNIWIFRFIFKYAPVLIIDQLVRITVERINIRKDPVYLSSETMPPIVIIGIIATNIEDIVITVLILKVASLGKTIIIKSAITG